jgi:hypothetical protein
MNGSEFLAGVHGEKPTCRRFGTGKAQGDRGRNTTSSQCLTRPVEKISTAAAMRSRRQDLDVVHDYGPRGHELTQ